MSDPYVLELSPDKPNFFLVCKLFTSLTEIFKSIGDSLSGLERIIVFCKQISLCNEIYLFFCMFLVRISQSLRESQFGIIKLGSWMSSQQGLMKGLRKYFNKLCISYSTRSSCYNYNSFWNGHRLYRHMSNYSHRASGRPRKLFQQ